MLKLTHINITIATVAFIPCVLTLFFGDILYIGLWYYILVPVVGLGLGALFQANHYYLLGLTLAITTTFLTYMMININIREGLLALGHLFSLPGCAIGITVGAIFAKYLKQQISILLVGFFAALGGFFINQLIVCNSFMYCGILSVN